MKYYRSDIFVVLLAISSLCWSCSSFGGTLKQNKMIDVIYEMTIADGVLMAYGANLDSINRLRAYSYIFEKHKITKKKFDKTLKWYLQNPKYMEVVLDSVKLKVDRLKVDVESYRFHPEEKIKRELNSLDTIELRKFKNKYLFNDHSKKDSLRFKIDNKDYFALEDRIILKFIAKIDVVENEDSTENPIAFLKINYADQSEKKLEIPLKIDGKKYKYTFCPAKKDSVSPISIEGSVFNHSAKIRSIEIDSAKLLRIYNHKKYPLSDSLMKKFDVEIKQEPTDDFTLQNNLIINRNFMHSKDFSLKKKEHD